MTGLQTEIEQAIALVESRISELELLVDDDLSTTNYAQELNDYYNLRRKLLRMKNANRFYRLSRDSFFNLNASGQKEITHIVKDYETVFSIANQYNVTADDILKTNNVQTGILQAGQTIKIIVSVDTAPALIRDDFPVFGELDGENVLGRDISNDILTADGDIKILTPHHSFAQGIKNRLTTTQGNYPELENFGINAYEGKDLEEEVRKSMMKLKVSELLVADARVEDVLGIEIERIDASGISGTITVKTIDKPISVRI